MSALGQHGGTGRVGFLAILFQPGLEQFILHRDAAQQFAVGKRAAIVGIFGRAQNFAQFQSAPRPHDHPAASRIAHRVHGRKPADLAHRPDAN